MIDGLIVALQFLTRLPVNIMVDFSSENIKKSKFFFPYVGLIIGFLSSLVFYFLGKLNIEIGSLTTVIFMIGITGGLHLDGLSDTFDGFFANKDKETTLEIMKDSRIGAFGVLSIVVVIMYKYVIIKNIPVEYYLAIMFSMGNARATSLIAISTNEMSRKGGLGDMIHSSTGGYYVVGGLISYTILLLFINYLYMIPFIMSIIFGELVARISRKKIGGLTGDVYGAIIEITEAISLVGFLGVIRWIL